MKRFNFWMLVAILSCGLLTTSCTSEDNPVTPVDPTLSESIDEFWDMPGNAGDPEVVAALKSIKNVEDLKPFLNVYLGQCYYFNYNQMVDHNDPSKGTFKQQVVLTFVGKDAPTILHTQGYSLTTEADPNNVKNHLDSIKAPHFLWALSKDNGKDKKFDVNCLQVEYRYLGFSLPEGDKDSFTYMTAEQHSKDLHAIVADLKKGLITGSGKWLSTGVSKNGDTSTQYAYFDELNGWNDIDVYVPFASPNTIQEEDIRIGTYMLTQSSKEALPALEKAYKKLVDDRAVADATIEAYAKNGGKFKKDSALLSTVEEVLGNLFQLQSYADYNTWTKLIPRENDKPETYAKFFMLKATSPEVEYKVARARGPLHKRRTPYEVQNTMEQGGAGFDFSWFLDGKLLSESDKKYFKDIMEKCKKSKTMDLQVNVRKNLETTKKKLIFVYGEDDPWTGAAIPDPTNPNVKKYIVPHGTHTDDFKVYARYPGGQEVADKIMADVKAILFP
jgi:hypothetical protein